MYHKIIFPVLFAHIGCFGLIRTSCWVVRLLGCLFSGWLVCVSRTLYRFLFVWNTLFFFFLFSYSFFFPCFFFFVLFSMLCSFIALHSSHLMWVPFSIFCPIFCFFVFVETFLGEGTVSGGTPWRICYVGFFQYGTPLWWSFLFIIHQPIKLKFFVDIFQCIIHLILWY